MPSKPLVRSVVVLLAAVSVVGSAAAAAPAEALQPGPTPRPGAATAKATGKATAVTTTNGTRTSPSRTATTPTRDVVIRRRATYGSGTVTGVVRGPDGTPVSGVVVTVTSPAAANGRTWSATSGAGGRYSITGVPAPGIGGEWCADAAAQAKPLASLCQELPLRSFGPTRTLTHDVWLRTGRTVSGVVRTPGGAAIPGAQVWVQTTEAYGIAAPVAARAVAGTSGTFAFRAAHGRQLEVCAAAPAARTTAAPYGWAAACTQGVLPGGDPLTFELQPAGGIAGKVTDPAGAPVAGVRIHPLDDTSGRVRTWSGPDGTWTLAGVAPWQGVLGVDAGQVPGAHGTGFVWQVHTDPASGNQVEVVPVAGELVEGADDVLQKGAAVTGRVTSPAGAGVARATVTSTNTRWAHEPGRTTVARDDGTYRIVGIRPGYTSICVDARSVPASGPNVVAECWKDTTPGDPTGVQVTAGKTVSGISPVLDAAGSVVLTVTDDAGKALGGAQVSVDTHPWDTRLTGPDGKVTFRHLPSGQRGLSLRSGTVEPEMSPTGVFDALSTGVVVGGATATRTLVAQRAAAVTGRVTDLAGQALDLVDVGALSGGTLSDGEGRYTLRGLDASSTPASGVCFWAWKARGPSPTGYLPRCYGDVNDPYSAQPVPLTNGQVTRLPDVPMSPAGSISGRLVAPDGTPVGYVGVSVSTREGLQVGGYLSTDEEGRYTVTGIAPGEYVVCFSPHEPYGPECWDDAVDPASATAVTIGPGEVRTGVDAVLDPLTSVSGTVRAPDGSPVAGAEVTLDRGSSFLTTTDDDGTWTVSGVPRGDWRVCVRPVGELVGECWKDALPDDYEHQVPVTVGKTSVSGIDLTPPRGGVITGKVTLADGTPLAQWGIQYMPSAGGEVRYASTGVDGAYRLVGLLPGQWDVCVPWAEDGYLPECYDDGPATRGTPVTVTLGATTSSIDIELGKPGSVTARVLEPDGTPAAGAFVRLTSPFSTDQAWTDEDGVVAIEGLHAREYSLCATGYGRGGETCFGQTATAPASPLVIGSGQAVTGVVIRLLP